MSCLFDSISFYLQEDSNQVRQKICDYLEQNLPLIDGLETKDILAFEGRGNYVEAMRLQTTWGGGIEIQCACNLWKLRINVINQRDNGNSVIEFIPIIGNIQRTISLKWTGGHYEPL